ncbi:MAG: single-stranded-DNA-specific exonuclease RecJ [Phycisphaerae bacterium]
MQSYNAEEPCSFLKRRWTLAPTADRTQVTALSQALGLQELTCRLLLGRDLGTPETARQFLQPEFKHILPPHSIPGLEACAEIIARAVTDHKKITIYGDYDVDGITGTSMLYRLFKLAGADFDTYIPHRIAEGYGLSVAAVEEIARRGTQVLLTVDCGITARQAVRVGCQCGMTMVLTDHHEPDGDLPLAHAIAHPRLRGSTTGNTDLCGAGVAYKLIWAVAARLCGSEKLSQTYRDLLIEFTALVALATVADVVPLRGENRILVNYGLKQLARSGLIGLQALVRAAGLENRSLDGTAAGFSLGPRLNAAGRMGHADMAVELLTTEHAARAAEIAGYLEAKNKERQGTERKITAEAMELVRQMPELPSTLVLCRPHWHAGVVGIVAARLVDQFHRPCFVLTDDGQTISGSGRSIPGFPLHDAITYCRDLLISGGGHAAAGGIKLRTTQLNAFMARLGAYADAKLPVGGLVPTLELDGELEPSDIDFQAFSELEALAPFGHSNPKPKFLLRGAEVAAPPRRIGLRGSHITLRLKVGRRIIRAVGFTLGEAEPLLFPGMMLDLVVHAAVDRYDYQPRLELHIIDLARQDGGPLRNPEPTRGTLLIAQQSN